MCLHVDGDEDGKAVVVSRSQQQHRHGASCFHGECDEDDAVIPYHMVQILTAQHQYLHNRKRCAYVTYTLQHSEILQISQLVKEVGVRV